MIAVSATISAVQYSRARNGSAGGAAAERNAADAWRRRHRPWPRAPRRQFAPLARCAAIAAANVQPVPCVFRPSMRGPTNSWNWPCSSSTSTISGPVEMAALDHHRRRLQRGDAAWPPRACRRATDGHLREHLRLGDVGRDHPRQPQQRPAQRVDRLLVQQVIAALGDHHRIHHQVGQIESTRPRPPRPRRSVEVASMPVLTASQPMSADDGLDLRGRRSHPAPRGCR